MTQVKEDIEDMPSPTHKSEKRHTAFSVVDILNPTKFNGTLSPKAASKPNSLHSQDHSEHELSGKFVVLFYFSM